MIVALHAASGAAAGAVTRSRLAALVLGPVLHVAADRVPHRHPSDELWEYIGGVVAVGLVAGRRGLFDAATLGAVAAVLPDAEHLAPALRLRGVKVFHPRPGGPRSSAGVSVGIQALVAALILAPLLRRAPSPSR
jgi:hypothetical protein